MKKIFLSFADNKQSSVFIGIKEFPSEQVILLTLEQNRLKSEKIKQDLERFKIPTELKTINLKTIWRDLLEIISKLRKDDIIINTSTDEDPRIESILTSLAYLNGKKAYTMFDEKIQLLPILKYSYYDLLNNKKMEILKILFSEKDGCKSLETLSKKTKMSLPLISYHINGTKTSAGLKELSLIESIEKRGKIEIKITKIGELLIEGYQG